MGFSKECDVCFKRYTSKEAWKDHQHTSQHSEGIHNARVEAVGELLAQRFSYVRGEDGLIHNRRANALEMRGAPASRADPSPAAVRFYNDQQVKKAVAKLAAEQQDRLDEIERERANRAWRATFNAPRQSAMDELYADEDERELERSIRAHFIATAEKEAPPPTPSPIITKQKIEQAIVEIKEADRQAVVEVNKEKRLDIIRSHQRIDEALRQKDLAEKLEEMMAHGSYQAPPWHSLPPRIRSRGLQVFQKIWWEANIIGGSKTFMTPNTFPPLYLVNKYFRTLSMLSAEAMRNYYEQGVQRQWVVHEEQESESAPIAPRNRHQPGYYRNMVANPLRATLIPEPDSEEQLAEVVDKPKSDFLKQYEWITTGKRDDQFNRAAEVLRQELLETFSQFIETCDLADDQKDAFTYFFERRRFKVLAQSKAKTAKGQFRFIKTEFYKLDSAQRDDLAARQRQRKQREC